MPRNASGRGRAGNTRASGGHQAKAAASAFRYWGLLSWTADRGVSWTVAALSTHLSHPPVVDPVLSRQQAFGAHRPDHEVAGEGRGAGEVIGPPRAPRGALDPRHARAAQARVALHGGRYGRSAFGLGFAEAFGE